MKKIYWAIFMVILFASSAQAQILVNDIDINSVPDLKYVQVTYTEYGRAFSQKNTKGTIVIDYGQDYQKFKELIVKDGTGKVLQFNSMIDVLNFFNKNDWDLFSFHTTKDATQGVTILSAILIRKGK